MCAISEKAYNTINGISTVQTSRANPANDSIKLKGRDDNSAQNGQAHRYHRGISFILRHRDMKNVGRADFGGYKQNNGTKVTNTNTTISKDRAGINVSTTPSNTNSNVGSANVASTQTAATTSSVADINDATTPGANNAAAVSVGSTQATNNKADTGVASTLSDPSNLSAATATQTASNVNDVNIPSAQSNVIDTVASEKEDKVNSPVVGWSSAFFNGLQALASKSIFPVSSQGGNSLEGAIINSSEVGDKGNINAQAGEKPVAPTIMGWIISSAQAIASRGSFPVSGIGAALVDSNSETTADSVASVAPVPAGKINTTAVGVVNNNVNAVVHADTQIYLATNPASVFGKV